MDYTLLSNILFPNIQADLAEIESRYPKRNLPETARVTRFAPSPTGFMHIGGLFAALISERIAHQSGGVFYLRIEDTDKKREIEGGIAEIVSSLCQYNIFFDEGAFHDGEKGNYSPYKQSERVFIYQAYAKSLVEKGLAYPCFCSEDELTAIRKTQEEQKENPGYYEKWAVCRELPFETIQENIKLEKPFVLRLKSQGNPDKRMIYKDLIKGDVEVLENNQDIVLLKSDGVPTYHFAHAVDDYLMRTTHVIRGDEWLSSLPIHLQLFQVLGFKAPKYAHLSPVMKLEGSSKRKLSKRKDPEAAVLYYQEQGYPVASVIDYLLTLANSNFEDWRRTNQSAKNTDFILDLKKMSVSGALFDIVKLSDISKNVIAQMDAEQVFELSSDWAKDYDKELFDLFNKTPDFTKKLLAIGRGGKNPRKDFAKWFDLKEYISYFYEETYKPSDEFPANVDKDDIKEIINQYKEVYDETDDNEAWFEKLKQVSEKLGFSPDVKAYKNDPTAFKGHVGDVSLVIRVAVTGRQNTPDLHDVMQILGKDTVIKRLNNIVRG